MSEKLVSIEEVEKVLEEFADENHFQWQFYFLPIIRNKLKQHKSNANSN